MTSPSSRRLTWNERKEAQRIASELLRIHKQDPEALRDEVDQVVAAVFIRSFDARFLNAPSYARILANEDHE